MASRLDRWISKDYAVDTLVKTDFYRQVYCVLGLPFDAMTMEQAQAEVSMAIAAQRRCFFSTPNLNFLIGCLHDAAFRDSVLHSDLSFADGMPIIWIARALGIPLRARVAGSTLFERLREQATLPVKVFFFGGQNGVAQQAAAALNATPGSMRCVGAHSPGFGSIDDMSGTALIDEINQAHPDFLVVALGAKRGQMWIEHNMARLEVPLVSHLGAVLNFVAGTVMRAPARLGGLGLEWLWRIKEEPALWRRYRDDGLALLALLLTRVIPSALSAAHFKSRRPHHRTTDIAIAIEGKHCKVTLAGDWHDHNLLPLRAALEAITAEHCHIVLNLEKVTSLDSACIGLLSLLFGHQSKIKHGFTLLGISPAVRRTLRLYCAEYLMTVATTDGKLAQANWVHC